MVREATSCWWLVSASPSFRLGWLEDLVSRVLGTVMQDCRWCTLCSSGSHLGSLLLNPTKQRNTC